MRSTNVLTTIVMVISCTSLPSQSPAKASPVYFPSKVFAKPGRSRSLDGKLQEYLDGKLQEAWFGGQLMGLQEPSLLGRRVNEPAAYRFILLPSFGHPVIVRVDEHADGTATVTTRVGKGAGGYAPEGLLVERASEVSADKVMAIRAAINKSKFWSLPTEPIDQGGDDGTEWIFEGAKDGRYHVVDRWEGRELRSLGMFFLQQLGQPDPEAKLSSSLE